VDAYVYQAALLCGKCGSKVRKELARRGNAPLDPKDEHTYDSDDFPKGPYSKGGGEADTPQHCDSCGVFLENPLTRDGYQYVEGAVRDDLRAGKRNSVAVKTWAPFYDIDVEKRESTGERITLHRQLTEEDPEPKPEPKGRTTCILCGTPTRDARVVCPACENDYRREKESVNEAWGTNFYFHVYPETAYSPGKGWHNPDPPTGKWVLSHSSLADPRHGGGQMLMVGTKDECLQAANNMSKNAKSEVKVWNKVGEDIERIVDGLLEDAGPFYQVFVGNSGAVYAGRDQQAAREAFDEYVERERSSGVGDKVVLKKDGVTVHDFGSRPT
jgi:hypothetical protein